MEKDTLNQQLIKYAGKLLAKSPSEGELGEKFLSIFRNILRAKVHWEKAVDVLTDPIIIINNNHRIMRMNKATTIYFQKEYRKILGMDCRDLLYGSKANYPAWMKNTVPGDSASDTREVDDLVIPGTFLWILYSLPLKDFNGAVIYLRDITELKKAEQALKASEWKFESLIECSPNGILLIKDKKILFSNRAASRILGYSEEEIRGLDFLNLIWEEENPQFSSGKRLNKKEDRDLEFLSGQEFQIITKQGTRKWLHFHFIEITLDHDLTQMINIADITQIKDAELQLIQSEKMATIGQLAAGMAHEINTPVGFIKSNLGSLKQYIGVLSQMFQLLSRFSERDGPPSGPDFMAHFAELKEMIKAEDPLLILEDIKSIAEDSLQGIETISRIIQGIRDFSQVDSGELVNICINDLIEQSLLMTGGQIKKINHCKTNFEKNLPKILCNPQKLNQVFINLIINAIEAIEKKSNSQENFAAEHGFIEIDTALIRDANEFIKNKIQIIIKDNGCGISLKNQGRIFDPFFTTKEFGQGTGLGMSIVYDIISKINGNITVRSREGKGTEFTLLLPIENLA